jgi:ABC-type uncharacterized transport system substrate-binding protein
VSDVKRITVWIDSKDANVEKTLEKLKEFLAVNGIRHKIVEVCELIEPREGK